MFGNDYVFTNHPSTEEGMIEMLKEYSFNENELEQCMDAIRSTSGGYCVVLTRQKAENIASIEAPHFMKRLVPPIGSSVVVVNLAELTPDEELAIAAHEFGHIYHGHLMEDGDFLEKELAADWFAVVGVGAIHMYNALAKVAKKFNVIDDEVVVKRLETIRQYL